MWFSPLLQGGAQIQATVTGIYRPSSDISLTGWTGVPDNVNLYANIDEVTPSDTDYITSVVTGASPATMGIGPMVAGTYVVRVRAATTSGTGIVRVKLLDSSGATLGTSADQSITTTPTNYDLSVTTSGTAARVSIEIA